MKGQWRYFRKMNSAHYLILIICGVQLYIFHPRILVGRTRKPAENTPSWLFLFVIVGILRA